MRTRRRIGGQLLLAAALAAGVACRDRGSTPVPAEAPRAASPRSEPGHDGGGHAPRQGAGHHAPAHADGQHEAAHEASEHEELPRVVRLSPEVVRASGVAWAPARRERLAATVDLNGQIVADPDHIAQVSTRLDGRIVKVLVREGDVVRAGQPVAVVTSPELARLRAGQAASAARAAAARANATRLRALVRDGLGAEQEALAAEAEAAAAEAERDALARTLRAAGAQAPGADPSLLEIASPIAGQVVHRDAIVGQHVGPAQALLTVADLSRAFFQAQLFEKDLAGVEDGAAAEVRLNGYPADVFRARVVRVASQIDPQARTLTARLGFVGPVPRVRLGLYGIARVSLPSPGGGEHVVVPLSAVTELGERKVVFVRHSEDGDFQVHDVRLGASAGGDVQVLSGLDEGEEVVTAGVHTLRSVVLKSTLDEEGH
jgi:cobalt-zinc-cadmium efflux system membrane fusion protein